MFSVRIKVSKATYNKLLPRALAMILSPYRLPNSAYRDLQNGHLRPNNYTGSAGSLSCTQKQGNGGPVHCRLLTASPRPFVRHSTAPIVTSALPAGIEDAPPAGTASTSADVSSIISGGAQPEIKPVSVETRWVSGGPSLSADASVPGQKATY